MGKIKSFDPEKPYNDLPLTCTKSINFSACFCDMHCFSA